MNLSENTLIIATVVAVVIYIWMRRSKNISQDAVPALDADERRRRREHFAKAAEDRVAVTPRQEKDPVALDSGQLKEKMETGNRASKESKSDSGPQTNSSKDTQKKTNVSPSVNKASKKTSIDTSASISDSTVEDNFHLSRSSASDSAKSAVRKDENTHTNVVDSAVMDLVGNHVKTSEGRTSDSPLSDTSRVELNQNAIKHEEKQAEVVSIPRDPIKIYLLLTSSPSTPKLSLTISPSFTAIKLRSLASEAANVPIAEVRLIYHGKVILDSMQCVGDCGLQDGSVLHLVGRPRNDVIRGASRNESSNGTSLDNAADDHGSNSIESTEELDIGSTDELNDNQSDATNEESNDRDEIGEAPPCHVAAAIGDMSTLRDAAINDLLSLYAIDHNGWCPIHEAARGGQTHVVTFLVQEAERSGVASNTFINAVTNFGNGWSPLALAIQHHGINHPVTRVLRQFGGQVIHPRR